MIIDPNFDERFAVAPWTLHYEVGRTTYLDTPIVPVAAFATIPVGNLDSGIPAGAPAIGSVIGNSGSAAICTNQAGTTLTLTAQAATDGRDNGFGDVAGSVTLNGSANGITIDSWSAAQITVTVGPLAASGSLRVIRGDNGRSSEAGLSVAIQDCSAGVIQVNGGSVYPYPGGSGIQAAIDAANPGDLILVGPGSYFENVIMWKPVHLQGAGAGVTRIFANPNPAERLQAWHDKTRTLLGTAAGAPNPFAATEAPGILVTGQLPGGPANAGDQRRPFNSAALIDGFEISGALSGGAIFVNNDAQALQISNNTLRSNQGNLGGGIVVGAPDNGIVSGNSAIVIRDNRVTANSGIIGPGGVAIYSGATNYLIENNRVVGNFSRDSGAGIGHVGLSDGGTIRGNRVLFNEVFYGLLVPGGGHGGGIFVSGDVPPPPALQLSGGAGNVTIEGNLVQGNLAGAGNGSGIAAFAYNGADVQANPGDPNAWYTLTIRNNLVVNNVAAIGGGGISLQDVTAGSILNNTVTHNDSTATALLAFRAGNLTFSVPQGAGIISSAHSQSLRGIAGFTQSYSDPLLVNNIIWQNRSFYNDSTINGNAGGLVPASQHQAAEAAYALSHPGYFPDPKAYADFSDLQVAGALNPTTDVLRPTFSVLTNAASFDPSNTAQDPGVVLSYFNDLQSSTVLDEGGNAITVRFTPLAASAGDYHLQSACSAAVDAGSNAGVTSDYDGEGRPMGGGFDIGADEYNPSNLPAATNILTLISPNGGESLTAGSNLIVRWTEVVGAASYSLGVSLSPGSPLRLIDNASGLTGGCMSLQIPANIAGNAVRFAVIARDASGQVLARDLSDGPLSIVTQGLLSPNGGEILTGGNTATITWTTSTTAAAVSQVAFWYQTEASAPWTAIGVTSDSGRFDWVVPTLPTTVATARVALAFYGADGKLLVTDVSAAPFTIVNNAPAAPAAALQATPAAQPAATSSATAAKAASAGILSVAANPSLNPAPEAGIAPTVEVVIPAGGEVFAAGESIPLLWSSPSTEQKVAGVEVSLSLDGGANWKIIGQLESDAGYLLWTVPALEGGTKNGLIEVKRLDAQGGIIDRDHNDAPFAITAPAN